MDRILCAVLGIQFVAIGPLSAQQTMPWKIRGDTSGAPRGCSAATGVSAVNAWFAAFHDADSARLVWAILRLTAVDSFSAPGGSLVRSHSSSPTRFRNCSRMRGKGAST